MIMVPMALIDVAETCVERVGERCVVVNKNTIEKNAHRIVRVGQGLWWAGPLQYRGNKRQLEVDRVVGRCEG